MIQRTLQKTLLDLAENYPVITIIGPRQAGKTTLARMTFPGHAYCNLEHPETRLLAETDPKSFFRQYPTPLIVDEIQRVPELLSYIQVQVDEAKQAGAYILTGSHQLTLHASIAQSLAGRTALLTLFPFSFKELADEGIELDRDTAIHKGFMPRIYDQGQDPTTLYRNYLHTYVEKDVRQLINLKDLTRFENFLRILAGRVGQLVNASALAAETGVSQPTVMEWLSVLEASFVIYRLSPYYENFGKRIIKSPKLYFVEVGLACYLLGIENKSQVTRDPLLGGLYENMVVMEAVKSRLNQGRDPNLYFFRDNHQQEIDLLYKKGNELVPIEIKASMTYNSHFKKSIDSFKRISEKLTQGYIVYAGEHTMNVDNHTLLNHSQLYTIFNTIPPR